MLIVHFNSDISFIKCKGKWVKMLVEYGFHFYLLVYNKREWNNLVMWILLTIYNKSESKQLMETDENDKSGQLMWDERKWQKWIINGDGGSKAELKLQTTLFVKLFFHILMEYAHMALLLRHVWRILLMRFEVSIECHIHFHFLNFWEILCTARLGWWIRAVLDVAESLSSSVIPDMYTTSRGTWDVCLTFRGT